MTTSHFIICQLICVFSIFMGSSVIFVEIQTGIITTLRSRMDLGSVRSNLGNYLGLIGVFHIFWTCLNRNSFYSSLLVSGAPPRGLSSRGDGGSNAPNFAYQGQELTLVAAVVIWVIFWGLPLSLAFFHILWTCLNERFVFIVSFCNQSTALRFIFLRRW